MTAIDQLRDEIANLHLLADRLARAGVDKPTIEECVKTYREAHQRSPHSSMVANHHDGIAAVRDLCLASRARDASWRIEVRGSQPQCWVVVDPSGDCGEQSFTVGPCLDADEREDAEHFARMTKTALERIASRAPSIDEVVDALLRVQPFRDGHETGSTGLVRRADVEQVMRALFDRRSK